MNPSGPGFVYWKIFNQSFNFSACDWSVYIFYFFLVQFWKVVLFLECVHFFQVFYFIGIQLLVVIAHVPLYFCSVSCYFSVFISNFIDLSPLPLFFDKPLGRLNRNKREKTQINRIRNENREVTTDTAEIQRIKIGRASCRERV